MTARAPLTIRTQRRGRRWTLGRPRGGECPIRHKCTKTCRLTRTSRRGDHWLLSALAPPAAWHLRRGTYEGPTLGTGETDVSSPSSEVRNRGGARPFRCLQIDHSSFFLGVAAMVRSGERSVVGILYRDDRGCPRRFGRRQTGRSRHFIAVEPEASARRGKRGDTGGGVERSGEARLEGRVFPSSKWISWRQMP